MLTKLSLPAIMYFLQRFLSSIIIILNLIVVILVPYFLYSYKCYVFLQKSWFTILIPYAPCMVYLPAKLGDFVRANVGIHIPAPWFAYGIHGL